MTRIAIGISIVALLLTLYQGCKTIKIQKENNKIQMKIYDLQKQIGKSKRAKNYNNNKKQLDKLIRLEKQYDKYCNKFFKKTSVTNLDQIKELDECFSKHKKHKSFWKKSNLLYDVTKIEKDLALQERVISAMKDVQIEGHPKIRKVFYTEIIDKKKEISTSNQHMSRFLKSFSDSKNTVHNAIGQAFSKDEAVLEGKGYLTNNDIFFLKSCLVQSSRKKILACLSKRDFGILFRPEIFREFRK